MRMIFAVARLPLFVIGLVLFFCGERYLYGSDMFMAVRAGSLALLVMSTLFTAFLAVDASNRGLKGEQKSWLTALWWQVMLIISPSLYLIYRKMMIGSVPDTVAQKVLLGTWLTLAILGIAMAIGVEFTRRSSGVGQYAESKRVTLGGINWLAVGMSLVFLLGLNFFAYKKNVVQDWSYFKTTRPGEASRKMIASLTQPLTISIFFPTTNEVKPSVAQYFDDLAGKAPNVKVEYLDKDINPQKADELKVARNGQVVLSYDQRKERIDIGLTTNAARVNLRKLDSLFQKAFYALTTERRTVYFTTGHGELSWRSGSEDPLRSISAIEIILRSLNMSLRTFGPTEGLLEKVPSDAAFVAIVGPSAPFQKEEVETLKTYVNNGGKLAVFLDLAAPDGKMDTVLDPGPDPLKEYLATIGLNYHAVPLANETKYLGLTKTQVDKWFLITNSFSSHESVMNLSRNSDQVQSAFFQTGYYDVQNGKDGWKTYETVRALDSTFDDQNKNFIFDANKEKKKAYAIAAAAEKDNPADKAKSSRIVAFGDATVLSDALIRNPGNQLVVVDTLKWLAGETKFTGETTSEEDVKIQHSKSRELVAFHGSIFGAPFLLLIAGFFATRRRKRKA